jgi:ferredoxin
VAKIHHWKVFSLKILTTLRMERCIGCHSCSLACARLVHKRLSWDTAGIRIASSGGLSTGFEAKNCLACDPAPCARACPTGAISQRVQKLRWKNRLAAGFNPREVGIPKRFTEIFTWKGGVDEGFLNSLKSAYAEKILGMGATDA